MNKVHNVLLLGILILAFILRFWGLGLVPASPDWDEASLGYNAYSILHTGRDEFGKFLPPVLESFGDYKPALYSYLSIPTIAIFGLNVFSVRLPSAILGLLTVLAVYFLVDELFKNKMYALVSSALLAVSPWNIQFSRVAFEANTGVAFNVFAALFFLKAFKKPSYIFLSVIFLALNLYVYQSEKVFTPLLALALILIYAKELFRMPKKYLFGAVITGIILSAPMLTYIVTNPSSLARAEGVSIFSQQTQLLSTSIQDLHTAQESHSIIGEVFDNRRIVFAKEVLSNYLSHYNFNWLFITGDLARHHAPNMGLLYLWDLPFLLIGIYSLLFHSFDNKTKYLVFSWFFLAPMPAAVTTGVPHAVRSMNFLPIPQILICVGIISFVIFIQSKAFFIRRPIFKKLFFTVIMLFFFFNFFYYLNQYFVQTNYFTAPDWQYGFEQVVSYVSPIHTKYQTVVVSDQGIFSQSYIFFLFYTHYEPSRYLSEGGTQTPGGPQKFANYQFRAFNFISETSNDTLYVGAPSDFPPNVKPLYTVSYPGSPLIAMEVVSK